MIQDIFQIMLFQNHFYERSLIECGLIQHLILLYTNIRGRNFCILRLSNAH